MLPMTVARPTLDTLVHRAAALYTLPGVAIEMLRLTSQPQIDVPTLRHCLEADPALSSKVLRVVNSSLFGLSRPVSDLGQALAMLGVKPLKLLVLGFSLPDRLLVNLAGPRLMRYWRQSLTTAVAARELAETIWHQPGDDAFLVGLFSDVGILLLLQELGQPYIELYDRAAGRELELIALERQHLGFDHRQLSARLLRHWGLPTVLTDALLAVPAATPPLTALADQTLPQILHLARLFASLVHEKRRETLEELLLAGQAYFEIEAADFGPVFEAVQTKVDQLAELLAIELPAGQRYLEIVEQAQQKLAIVGQAAATELLDRCFLELDPVAKRTGFFPARAPRPSGYHSTEPGPVVGHAPHRAPARAPRSQLSSSSADAGFIARIHAAADVCRAARSGLCLLLIEIDRFDLLVSELGVAQAQQAITRLQSLCTSVNEGQKPVQLAESRFALLLARSDRRYGLEVGNQLISELQKLANQQFQRTSGKPLSASIGLAAVTLPAKNFAAEALVECAERCLFGAKTSGGNSIKSIELY